MRRTGRSWSSAAKFYAGRYGPELVQDCVQLHGGIGITFDHHLHLFLRRVATNTPLFGTPGDHATRLTDLYEATMTRHDGRERE